MNYDLTYFIDKFEAIPEENWHVGEYHNREKTKFCAMGHCGEGYQEPYRTEEGSFLAKILSNIPLINDGKEPLYPQATPKQRILAALTDIKSLQAVKQAEDIINSPAQLIPC